MARWVVAPAACICRTIGSTFDAKLSAAFRLVATPFACASRRLVRLIAEAWKERRWLHVHVDVLLHEVCLRSVLIEYEPARASDDKFVHLLHDVFRFLRAHVRYRLKGVRGKEQLRCSYR